MKRTVRVCFLVLLCSMVSVFAGSATAQGTTDFEGAKQLNKQEIIDLIANKKISYRATVGSRSANTSDVDINRITFTKTDDAGGNLVAYMPKSSTNGTWYVNDNSRLVRQYEKVSWGNKPFTVGVFERGGKYYWKIGEVFQELISIE